MSFYKDTGDMDRPERRFTQQEYIDRHRELFAQHREAEAGSDLIWLRAHGHLLNDSRYHLQHDYGLTGRRIEEIERDV
jgi:hypothetical protein